jgi:hypothetical protein
LARFRAASRTFVDAVNPSGRPHSIPSVAKFDVEVRRRRISERADGCEDLAGGQTEFDAKLVEVRVLGPSVYPGECGAEDWEFARRPRLAKFGFAHAFGESRCAPVLRQRAPVRSGFRRIPTE